MREEFVNEGERHGLSGVASVAGLDRLWGLTRGDSRVRIAVLDGDVDLTHPSFAGSNLRVAELGRISSMSDRGLSTHGTHVASVIFGQHDGPVLGVAPGCDGLILPIYRQGPDRSLLPCTEEVLAQAIREAVRQGAQVINISGGVLSPTGEAGEVLSAAIADSAANAVIVAAAGNDGCQCLHIPGALRGVLAVGAMDLDGEPLPFSNWGNIYRGQGILAPGEQIIGAVPGGGTATREGTSYATAIVSGVTGLLGSLLLKRGRAFDVVAIRKAILDSAVGCSCDTISDCRQLLRGRLDVSAPFPYSA